MLGLDATGGSGRSAHRLLVLAALQQLFPPTTSPPPSATAKRREIRIAHLESLEAVFPS